MLDKEIQTYPTVVLIDIYLGDGIKTVEHLVVE